MAKFRQGYGDFNVRTIESRFCGGFMHPRDFQIIANKIFEECKNNLALNNSFTPTTFLFIKEAGEYKTIVVPMFSKNQEEVRLAKVTLTLYAKELGDKLRAIYYVDKEYSNIIRSQLVMRGRSRKLSCLKTQHFSVEKGKIVFKGYAADYFNVHIERDCSFIEDIFDLKNNFLVSKK